MGKTIKVFGYTVVQMTESLEPLDDVIEGVDPVSGELLDEGGPSHVKTRKRGAHSRGVCSGYAGLASMYAHCAR